MPSRKKQGISILFWGFALLISLFLAMYYFASLKAFGEEFWLVVSDYQWAFSSLFLFLVAMIVAKILAKLVRHWFRKISEAEQLGVDRTRLSIIQSLVTGIIYAIALILIVNSIPELRSYSLSLFAGAGFMAIIIGFAAQETISNIISGILIAVYRPFRVGERIEFNNAKGKVEDITLRHTVIKTWENKRLVVPNSLISKEPISNYSMKDEKMLMRIEMNISYDSGIDKARKIMLSEAKKHNDYFDPHKASSIIKKEEPLKVRLVEFGDSSVVLRLYFWAKDYPTGFKMACDLRESIKKRFDREGIEIPFPYRTLVYKKDLKKKKR